MKELYKALANFQQEVPIIHKATQGHNYTYASLDLIIKTINPVMKKNQLGFTQLLQGESIKTIIFHTESGDSLESIVEIPQGAVMKGMNVFQTMGSAITYLKRYSLGSMLGLITDKDIDASGEQVEDNGVNHPNVDPHAQGEDLRSQVIKAIISESNQVGETILANELSNENEHTLRDTLGHYVLANTERKAKEWIDKQMTMPKKSGTIEALGTLKLEATKRGFMSSYVVAEMTARFNEIKEGTNE